MGDIAEDHVKLSVSHFRSFGAVTPRNLGITIHNACTVVIVTSQSYGDTEILGGQNSKTPKLIDEKFSEGYYVGNSAPHAKIHEDRPIGDIVEYA